MVCRVADNRSLENLRQDLRLDALCHSRRPDCVHALPSVGGETLGAQGAALGYCQALIATSGDPGEHTRQFAETLGEIGLPWSRSHELFWGYRGSMGHQEYVTKGIAPLAVDGRVPVVITGLVPGRDDEEIARIVDTRPPVAQGHSILLRLVLTDSRSLVAAAALVESLADTARRDRRMPPWWPLFQGDLPTGAWHRLASMLGQNRRYLNIAANPFGIDAIPDELRQHITVAQLVVGTPSHDMSLVHLHDGMPILGAQVRYYDLNVFEDALTALDVAPTLIVLGPSQATWTLQFNRTRLQRFFPVIRRVCEAIWRALPGRQRELLYQLG